MSKLSIRLKITLWFALLMLIVVALTYVVILSISDSILRKSIQNNLIMLVEDNVDEIEFFSDRLDAENDRDADLYIAYNGGYLEIDDDFLDNVNGVSTALYRADGTLLYGENPIALNLAELVFADSQVQTTDISGLTWYCFDRQLTQIGLEGLWLRGVVSVQSEAAQISSIARMSLFLIPLLLIIAILGGYFIAGRMLRPIRQITVTATQISRGCDLKQRINLGEGDDEAHQLAAAFDGMFARLDTAFAAEKQFTSNASHELRTPMSVIMAQCEYSLEEKQSAEEYRKALRVIRRQGGRMTRLIEDMLTFTRLEQQTDSIRLLRLNLSELTDSICRDLALIADKNITLTAACQPNIFVAGDVLLLTRLITNLISNAYRYGKEDGSIAVSLRSDGEKAFLSVSDDGIGIAPDDQEKVFHRFYQADSARTGSGSGLGLAIAQEIASLHNGSISLTSKLDSGSTFTLCLKII